MSIASRVTGAFAYAFDYINRQTILTDTFQAYCRLCYRRQDIEDVLSFYWDSHSRYLLLDQEAMRGQLSIKELIQARFRTAVEEVKKHPTMLRRGGN